MTRTPPHSSSKTIVRRLRPNSHSATQATASAASAHPSARRRRHHEPPPRPRDLSQPITAQTVMKIVTMSPIPASGVLPAAHRAGCQFHGGPRGPAGAMVRHPLPGVGLTPPRDSRHGSVITPPFRLAKRGLAEEELDLGIALGRDHLELLG